MNAYLLRLTLIILLAGLVSCGAGDSTAKGEALLEVAERGDLSGLEALLKNTRQIDVRDHCDWTPLMKAALNGHLEIVQRLLASGAALDAVDNGGYTAMMLAASNDQHRVLDFLLHQGAMIDHQEATKGWSALIWAAGKGHLQSVEILLEQGADRTLKDFDGQTALEHARASGHQHIVERLRAAG